MWIDFIKKSVRDIKKILLEDTLYSLLWIVMIVPNISGFSMFQDRVRSLFWIIHFFLLTYLYGVGNIVYQKWYAETMGDYIKSFVNVFLVILIVINSYWFLANRPLVKMVFQKAMLSDDFVRALPETRQKYTKSIRKIKLVIATFYFLNHCNLFCIYLPNRIKLDGDYGMQPCVGLDLSSSPYKEICICLILSQEFTIEMVVLNWQTLFIVLICHTTLTFQLVAEEIMMLNNNNENMKEKLTFIIRRHVLILEIVGHLKQLYSMPIGVNFLSNAICTALFFFLSIHDWIMFIPIVSYCFITFFLYCYIGQQLVNGAEAFEKAVYSCGWENFSLKEKRMVYVMLMMAQWKVELLASDIVPVNIDTFATTLQGMFKFVTVFKV